MWQSFMVLLQPLLNIFYPRPNKIYEQIEFINKKYIITPLKPVEMERSPMLEIKEYLERKNEIV